MTKEEFLLQLGLSREEFLHLLENFRLFIAALNEAQQEAVLLTMPALAEAASSFDPKITSHELNLILKEILEEEELIFLGAYFCRIHRRHGK